MQKNPQIAFLNSALRSSDSPADLSRLLLDRYIALSHDERLDLAAALIMQIGANEALKRLR